MRLVYQKVMRPLWRLPAPAPPPPVPWPHATCLLPAAPHPPTHTLPSGCARMVLYFLLSFLCFWPQVPWSFACCCKLLLTVCLKVPVSLRGLVFFRPAAARCSLFGTSGSGYPGLPWVASFSLLFFAYCAFCCVFTSGPLSQKNMQKGPGILLWGGSAVVEHLVCMGITPSQYHFARPLQWLGLYTYVDGVYRWGNRLVSFKILH